jgi:tRNA-splicing ligase RtcB (3'-phosphate/5'-hydroxy nucleic acid ligase)
MKQVINTEAKPIKLWLDDIEDGALEQAKNLANLPFAYKWVSIMPDSHQGYGMPIGGVLATKDVVIPNAVGVDIGCGMCAVRASLTEIDTENIKKIFGGSQDYKGGIRSTIPVGFAHNKTKQDETLLPNLPHSEIIENQIDSALKQLGTLGGGNHFIEIQKGSDGYIWIMIHSGSRNLGLTVANHYNKIANELNKKYYSIVDEKKELAFLPLDTQEATDYIQDMNYCVEFALANRRLMMEKIKTIFNEVTGCKFEEMINIAHNYARLENHYGENVMVHRKGATLASEKTTGIIPGSQGTHSYIVRGKGNPESFNSCSHGAGRKMGRKEAERSLNLESEQKLLNDKGILHAIRGVKQLDEAPGAYKDIDVVMKNQEDLVEVLVELEPIAVIKG